MKELSSCNLGSPILNQETEPDMEHRAPSHKKFVDRKRRVREDESIIHRYQRHVDPFSHALEDEAIEVADLLEPKNDHISVDDVLCFDNEYMDKCFAVEGIPYISVNGLKSNTGGLDSSTTQDGKDELTCGFFDGMLHEVVEARGLQQMHGLSGACDDYLLDVEFPDRASSLYYGPESHYPHFKGSQTSVMGLTESSKAITPFSACSSDLYDKFSIHEFTSFEEAENVSNLFPTDNSSKENGKDMVFSRCDSSSKAVEGRIGNLCKGPEGSAVLTRKRLRKPTRRYIEEVSDVKLRNCRGRKVNSATSLKDKIGNCNDHHGMGFSGAIQVPFDFHVRKGRSTKSASTSGNDSDVLPSTPESEDDHESQPTRRSEKGRPHRKHHKLWTLSEVMKLIDGVSKYGVGKWTEIKKLLFPSSAYRTSVDLKDKWRNLLRASCAQLETNKEDEQGRRHAWRPLPKSVLRKVSELAIIYPYPRGRNSKLAQVTHITSPIPPTSIKDSPRSHGGRIVTRKNFT